MIFSIMTFGTDSQSTVESPAGERMKRFTLFLTILALAAIACGVTSPPPTLDMHTVSPPTLIPLPTLTLVPSATAIPTESSVPPPTASGSGPIRIQFPVGGISATVSNTVTYPKRVEYILRAMKNQQMTISINSAGNAANFSILGVADGQPLKRLENEDRVWTGNLPATQDYLISVAMPGGSAAFMLTVTIVWP
jgi:hypothetical protein